MATRGRHGKLWKAGLGWVGHGRRGETRRVLAGPGEASNGTALKTSGDLRNEGAGCFLKKTVDQRRKRVAMCFHRHFCVQNSAFGSSPSHGMTIGIRQHASSLATTVRYPAVWYGQTSDDKKHIGKVAFRSFNQQVPTHAIRRSLHARSRRRDLRSAVHGSKPAVDLHGR